MEDDNGLELSLGLSWGRSFAKAKDKSDNSLDTRSDDGDRSNKLINDFKNFLEGGTSKQESCMGSQRSDLVKPDDSFSNKFPSVAADTDASENLNGRRLWVINDNRSAEVDEEKRPETGHKRKSFFDEISNQKKHDRDSQNADFPDKSRPSHISINTDDGSTAENEDVADSEADGSTSRLVPQHDDGSKKYMRGIGPSEVSKEFHTVVESSMVDFQGQNKFTISCGKEVKVGNMPMSYGVNFPAQSVNMLNAPYSLPVRDSNSVGLPGVLPGMIQVMGAANSERAGTQHVMSGNLPVMFGYSPVQLPVLDKDDSKGLASHPQLLNPSYAGRPSLNTAAMPGIMHKPSEASQYNGMALDQTKGDRKLHANDGGSSYQAEDSVKGGTTVFGSNGESDKPRTEGFISELPSIRPGIAADLKFGGCGSKPNLPWVSAKGPGPNGKTISGVTYRFSPTEIKIVCACHGTHMSPEDFVRHAGEEDTRPDSGSGLAALPNNNPAASAQS